MTENQNRKIVEEYCNAFAAGDETKLERLVDSSFTFNAPPGSGLSGNKQGLIEMAQQYHTAFPDLRMTYSDHVIQGDNVALRVNCSATHKGEFMGIPPTNKKAQITGLSIVKLRNGKVVEDISEFDQLALMTAIGAIPPLGEDTSASPSESRPARPSSSRPVVSRESEYKTSETRSSR